VTEVSGLTIIAIEDADIPAVVALWERCELTRPWNEPQADIARPRQIQFEVLVGHAGDTIAATVMVGHDGHRGWAYYVAVDPDHQKRIRARDHDGCRKLAARTRR
jgi:hypothetical protein